MPKLLKGLQITLSVRSRYMLPGFISLTKIRLLTLTKNHQHAIYIIAGRVQSKDTSEMISAVPVSFLSLLDLEWN